MTDICERLVRFKDYVCVSSDLEVEAADAIEALRAENARLEKAVIELTEENRLVGLQMDRFADEIERLTAEMEELRKSKMGRLAWYKMRDKEERAARAAMGENDD